MRVGMKARGEAAVTKTLDWLIAAVIVALFLAATGALA